jgi:hypothetical protein
MEIYEQIEYKGHHINIYDDSDPQNPREWDNLGTIYTAHRRMQPEKDFDDNFDINEVFTGKAGDFRKSFLQKYIALPIWMYNHGGVTISTTPFSCPWDSGFFGIIAIDVEKARQEYGWKKINKQRRKKIETYLQGEIETLDSYYTGEVYGYTITPIDNEDNTLDSCWGFYGDDGLKYIKEECKAMIDTYNRNAFVEKLRRFWQQLLIPFPEFATA